jgi:hypothetical protein
VHISAMSQLLSLDGRHVCELGANPHRGVQHGLLAGSHTAPERNLQFESQHALAPSAPGSQSSPASTMPFPHCWSEINFGAFASPGVCRHVMFVNPPPPVMVPVMSEPARKGHNHGGDAKETDEQMLPMEHGENLVS